MKPRVLYYDIETAPNLAYVWGHYDQNVIAHDREWYIMCIAYKWMGERKAHAITLPDFKEYKKDPEDDSALVQVLWDLIDEADVVIAHNGDRFDMRKANARFICHGMNPPSPVQQIDTLKQARKHFMFNSNKLGDLGQHLGLGDKIPTGGFELWRGCMRGDLKAWAKMARYNKQDVNLLEKVYLAIRPWIKNHPSLNMIAGEPESCPSCLARGKWWHSRGYRYTKVSRFRVLHCQKCGSYASARLADSHLEDGYKPEAVSR